MRSRSNFKISGSIAPAIVVTISSCKFEEVGEIAVVSLGHDVMIGVGADQLRCDTHPTARLAHAALEDRSARPLLADLLDVDGLAL